jgi:hypothetical protein
MISTSLLATLLLPTFASAATFSYRTAGSNVGFVSLEQYAFVAGSFVDVRVVPDYDATFFPDGKSAWNCAEVVFHAKTHLIGIATTPLNRPAVDWSAIRADGTTTASSDRTNLPCTGDFRKIRNLRFAGQEEQAEALLAQTVEAGQTNPIVEATFFNVPIPDNGCYYDATNPTPDFECPTEVGITAWAIDDETILQIHKETAGQTFIDEDNGIALVNPAPTPSVNGGSYRAADSSTPESSGMSAGGIAALVVGFLVAMCACFATGTACTLMYTRSKATSADARVTGRTSRRGGISRSASGHVRH